MAYRPYLILAAALLAAGTIPALEEFVMPRMQRNAYLSHARPAETFGLTTIPGEDELTYRGSATVIPEQPVDMAFVRGPIPIIGIGGSSRSLKMNTLLDTGSPVSWMEFGMSLDFKAVFLGSDRKYMPYSGKLNTGDVPGYAAAVPKMKLGYVQLQNTPLYVRMALHSLGPLARGIESPHVDSVFGYDLLKNFEYIRIDFAETCGPLLTQRHLCPRCGPADVDLQNRRCA